MTRAIAITRYSKKFIPKHPLKILYHWLAELHSRFCCSIWRTCGISTRNILEKLQNRAIRFITYSAPFTLRQYKINIYKFIEINYQRLVIMDFTDRFLPERLKSFVILSGQLINYRTTSHEWQRSHGRRGLKLIG